MKKLLALSIYALDKGMMHLPVTKVLEEFETDAVGCKDIYTDPEDRTLYIESLIDKDPIEFFVDYVLFYAKARVESGISDYGILNNRLCL